MTAETLEERHGVRVLACAPDGPKLSGDTAAVDLIGEAFGHQADLVMIPVERLPDEFFTLGTGVAGEMLQKFVNYRIRLAFVGDISAHVERSPALRDLVHETNRGDQAWFLDTPEQLDERLQLGR